MLASAVQQSESAMCIHISPPSWAYPLPPSHPSRSPQSIELSSLCFTAVFHQLVYTWQCIYVNDTLNSSHSPLLPVSTSIFSTSVSLFLLCKQVEHLSKLKAKQVKLLGQDHIISYIIEKIRTYQFNGIKLLFFMGHK